MSTSPRGFSLLEMMIASSLALLVIAGAVSAGVYLQRRGFLEERTMETQNAGRAARDLLTPAVQRAGVGFGSAPLYLGGAAADVRYAVWPETGAEFSDDPDFEPPGGEYAALRSDALEIYEADIGGALRMVGCGGTDVRRDGTSPLCLAMPAPADAPGGLPAGTPVVAANPQARAACVGLAQAARNAGGLNNLGWTPGASGATPFPAVSTCTGGGGPAALWNDLGQFDDSLLLPLASRVFRVNWASGGPVLEMDPDGRLGPRGFQPLSDGIERLRVRLGIGDPDDPGAELRWFPDPTAAPPRPAVDQCTNATCWDLIPGDAGTQGPDDFGPGSARDELMRRVRVVELLVTARSRRVDLQAVRRGADEGVTYDDEGNPRDGYQRRHFLIRVTPRNFALAGG